MDKKNNTSELNLSQDSLDTPRDVLRLVQNVFSGAVPHGFISNSYNSDTFNSPVYDFPSRVSPELAKAVHSIRKRESRLDMLKFYQLTEKQVYGLFKEAIERHTD